MTLGVDHIKLIQAYRAAHPDVDWDTHRAYIGKDRDGIWNVRGHRPIDPEFEAAVARIDACDSCCYGCDECQWRR